MSKNEEPNIFDFSDDWEEIQPAIWQWVMWDTPNQEIVGWIIHLRMEEFTDKQTGEKRENLVCYMLTTSGDSVRFIVPTDLKIKIDTLDEKRKKANREWADLMLKIVYTGKSKTLKGYEIKTFKVMTKKAPIPDKLKEYIPELPSTEGELSILEDLTDNE